MSLIQFNPEKNIHDAISPYKQYCDGFKSPGASGGSYINSLILSIGKSSTDFYNDGSETINGIVAYDNAEIETAYIGQINMTIVSSFSGPNGLIWGYDLVQPDDLRKPHPLVEGKMVTSKNILNVYDINPLLKASQALFGTNRKRHFPFIPGAHVPCAGRFIIKRGPCHIYSAMSISIPKDRSKSASLLMEDVGHFSKDEDNSRRVILSNIINSALVIGKKQDIGFKNIYVGIRDKQVEDGEIACAMAIMPYFSLAQKAVINNNYKKLLDISLIDWREKAEKNYLQ